jgi:integrase
VATKTLTDKTIAAAKAEGGKRIELWDAKTPGLCLRVTARLKTWVYRYRAADGRQPRLTLGEYPDMGLADAQAAARSRRNEVHQGIDPQAERKRLRAEAKSRPLKTLADVWDAYLIASETGEWKPRGKKKRASTLAEETGLWNRHIKTPLGELRIEDVSPDAIKKVLRSLVAAKHGVTSNRVRSQIRQILNFAIAEGRLEHNPVSKVAPLGTEQARERVLSDPELKGLWGALSNPDGLRKPLEGSEEGQRVYIGEAVRIALKVLLLTLARRAEIAGMRVDELDLEHGNWLLPAARTKAGRQHLIGLPPEAVVLIKRALELAKDGDGEPSPYVFPSPRDRSIAITPGALSHSLRDIRLALGVLDIRPHDFRRTAASLLASERLGASPILIGRLLNHSSETGGAAAVTLRHYALHDYANEKRRALEAWEGLLLEIVGDRVRPNNVKPIGRAHG